MLLQMGIIGYGGMAEYHAKTLAVSTKKIKVKGVYDINPERMKIAENDGFAAYESAEKLLSDKDIDIVLVATPNDLHKEYVIAAAKAKKHIICEKPAALSVSEFKEMINAAEKNKVVFSIHQNRRWDKDFLTAAEIYKNSKPGVYEIISTVSSSHGMPGAWRYLKKHGGGIVLDWGVHLCDQLLTLIDSKVKSVYCRLDYLEGSDVDQNCYLVMEFENGVRGKIDIDTNCYVPKPRWILKAFDKTAIINDWDINGKIVKVIEKDYEIQAIVASAGLTKTMAPRKEGTIKELPLPKVETDYTAFYNNYVNTVLGKEKQAVSNASVMRTMRLLEAAFLSAEKNEVVKVDI